MIGLIVPDTEEIPSFGKVITILPPKKTTSTYRHKHKGNGEPDCPANLLASKCSLRHVDFLKECRKENA